MCVCVCVCDNKRVRIKPQLVLARGCVLLEEGGRDSDCRGWLAFNSPVGSDTKCLAGERIKIPWDFDFVDSK